MGQNGHFQLQPIYVSCLGLINEIHILGAFDIGADAILLLGSKVGKCNGFKRVEAIVSFVRKILRAFGIEEERVEFIQIDANELRDSASIIKKLATEVAQESIVFKEEPVKINFNEGTQRDILIKILQNFSQKLNIVPSLILKDHQLPFAKVIINEGCVGCGVCAIYCNTNALQIENWEEESFRYTDEISFIHSYCVGCGICADLCPMKAITLGETFDLKMFIQQEKIVHRPELVACLNCGKPFISKNLLEKMKAILQDKSVAGSEEQFRYLEYCYDCREEVWMQDVFNKN